MAGEKLQLGIINVESLSYGSPPSGGFSIKMGNVPGHIVWDNIADPVGIEVISPGKLLDRLLRSMNEGKDTFQGVIKQTVRKFDTAFGIYRNIENGRLRNTFLIAAESLRGLTEAKVYSSFRKFCEFMEAEFGYIYDVSYKGTNASGQKYDILNNSVEFDGFTELKVTDSYITDRVNAVKFSTTSKAFVGIVCHEGEGGGMIIDEVASNFPGDENYRVVYNVDGVDVRGVREDVYFHDLDTHIYYVGKRERYNDRLIECELAAIDQTEYEGIRYFGRIETAVDRDLGIYTGSMDVANVVFVRALSKFMYSNTMGYYGSFSGDFEYNNNGSARDDMVFLVQDQGYVMVGSSLMRYCGELPDFNKPVEEDMSVAVVTFKHRSEVFREEVIKTIDLFNEPEYGIDSSRIYSELKVGYEKQDYESDNNGHDEFNFTSYYTSGVTLKEATLSLVCPYRADCHGIEELMEKRGADTSRTDSDTHLFIVKVSRDKVDGRFRIDRSLKVEGAYSDTVFNATYAPIYMIEANKGYIGMFTDKLKFASSDGNSSIVIGGIAVSGDIAIKERMFTCGNLTLKTDDLILPDKWEGVVQFRWNNCVFTGFLKSVDVNYLRNEAFEYKLIEKGQTCMP